MFDGKAGKNGLLAATIFGAVAGGVAVAVFTRAVPKILGTMQEMTVRMREN